jgi:hypothetical protein
MERFHLTIQLFNPWTCVIIIIVTLLVSGCTTVFPDGKPGTTTVTATITPGNPPDCGLTPCHGLDLTCGPDIPEVCTAVYQLGDKCRQFTSCTTDSNGTCRMETKPEFDTCRTCVQTCLNESRNDPSKSFACEEKC